MLSKLFGNEEEIARKKEERRLKKEEELKRQEEIKLERAAKEKEEELKRLRKKEYIINATKEEVLKPGTHNTIIKIATNGEGLFGVDKTVMKIEKWLNSFINHRSQIINISAKRDQGLIEDYTVTYWEIVVPEDWDSKYEKMKNTI